ncbi:hypothetical protein C1886_18720 [Pseudomonas sp. FW300-N1A1]|nr:hypothetical protein C1886_18720 [Pseudomonas sp. FW300-N1A1]
MGVRPKHEHTQSNTRLWRASLLALGCIAALIPATANIQIVRYGRIATASRPSGSKLPRHQ